MKEHICPNCGYDYETPLKTKPLTNAMNHYVYEGDKPEGKKFTGMYNAEAQTIEIKGFVLKRKDVKQIDPTKKAEYVLASPSDLGKTAPSGADSAPKQPVAPVAPTPKA